MRAAEEAERVRLLLELNTIITATLVHFTTHVPSGGRGGGGDASSWASSGFANKFGQASFWLMFGTVMLHFAVIDYGRERWTREILERVHRIITAVRLMAVFPFAVTALALMVLRTVGWARLVVMFSTIWVFIYVLHVLRRRKISLQPHRRLVVLSDPGSELVVDEDRGREAMRDCRRVVPGDTQTECVTATGLETAEPSSVQRSCSLCADALPNTRYRPCGHSAACESCLLRWASVTTDRLRCPVCNQDVTGYDVAAEAGESFLHAFVQEAGSDDADANALGK